MKPLKLTIILFTMILSSDITYCQVEEIDSLKRLLNLQKEDSIKVNILYEISELSADDKDVLEYAERAFKLATKLNYKKGIADALNNIGYVYNNQTKIPEAYDFYKRSLDISEEINYQGGQAIAINNIARIFLNQGNIPKALTYYFKSLKISEKIGDKQVIALSLNNIAYIYEKQGEMVSAEKYYRKSLDLYKEIGDRMNYASLMHNIGSIHAFKGNQEQALIYYKASLKIREELGDKNGIGYSYLNSGFAYGKLNMDQLEIDCYNKCLQVWEETGRKDEVSKALYMIADFYLRHNEFNKAEMYGERALSLAKEIGYVENVKNTSGKLCIIYEKLGNYKKAYKMYVLFKQMSDSLNNMEYKKITIKKEMQYEFEKKDAHIKQLKVDNKLQATIVQQQNMKKNFAYTGIAALLLFGGFTYNRYRQRKKLSEQLSTSLNDLKQTQQSLILSEREKEAEQLRVRISRDIHDDMGSNLSRLALQSELLASGRINNAEDMKHSLIEIAEYSRSVVNDLGEIVWSVTPQHDTLQSLIDFMQKHLDNYLKETGIVYHTQFKIENGAMLLRPDIKRNLFLVFKEAINNTVKYADAKNIFVEISEMNRIFEMKVVDDGKGFNVDEKMYSGNGLTNMYERIKLIEGEAKIISSPEKGCEVSVKVTI
jgi:two-component system sensor histidine kinase UhpB